MHTNSTLQKRSFRAANAGRIATLAAWGGLLSLGLLTGCNTDTDSDERASATVALVDTTGKNVGSAQLSENGSGVVSVDVTVSGLPAGSHGIHFHENGVAEPNARPAFSTAGEHFNPGGREHGLENPNGVHGGDLPNLVVDAQGNGTLNTTTNRITLSEGANSLFDANGSTLIIHAATDDQKTNPSGNSGGRIVGGVVVRD